MSVVYIVQIGKWVKVGYSTDLEQRLQSFTTGTAEPIKLLAMFPGGRSDEARLHRALEESRVRGEFFHLDYRLSDFIGFVRAGDLEAAWKWLDHTAPASRQRRKLDRRQARLDAAKAAKAERDAHCAHLVAERKARLGW